jgi:hypothetical protein
MGNKKRMLRTTIMKRKRILLLRNMMISKVKIRKIIITKKVRTGRW